MKFKDYINEKKDVHKERLNFYHERMTYHINRGLTFDSAADQARDDLKKRKK